MYVDASDFDISLITAPGPIVFKNPENNTLGSYAKSSIATSLGTDDQRLLILKYPLPGSVPVFKLSLYLQTANPPGCPDVPAVALVPDVPDVPLEPDVPEEPFAPLVPLVPELPSVPLVPAVPAEPDVPLVPLLPSVPELPSVPDVPLEPSVPDVPLEPSVPLVPS